MRVQMSYHIFNNISELINGYLAAKIGQGILSADLIDRECNCYLPYMVNSECVYEGKPPKNCLIYKVQCYMYEATYIGNTKPTFKKIMDGHFSDLLRLLKNGQKSDSFAAY